MSVEQLLFEHYDGVIDSPEAVSKLRNFIFDYAVRGRLVDQYPDDEPAVELLKRISAERSRLIESIESRNLKPSDSIESPQFSHLIPLNWSWTRIAHLGLINPKNKLPDSLEASFVPMRLIASKYSATSQHEKRLWGKIRKGYTHFAEGDVGLAKITPCFENGKSTVFRNLTGGVGSGTTELHILRPLFVLADYVLIFLKRRQFIETGIQKMTGTAGHKRVPLEYFVHAPFPLPPLAEQHRIVAKVDELMARCDRLDEKFKEREDHRKRLTKASFDSLTESGIDESEFKKRGGFVVKNFDRLSVDVDQIRFLRQLILDLAVRGRLVQQDPKEEPAAELLDRIRKEKQLLIKSGAIKIQKPLAALDKLPFDLPSSWKWKRLGEIAEIVRGVSFPASAKSNTPSIDLLPCLRSGNIQRSVVWKELIYVPNTVVKDSSKFVRESDVLISIANSYELVGKCAIVHSVPLQATFGAFLAAIRLHVVSPKFASLFLMSTYSSSAFRIESSQTTNIANITFSTIRSHPFPLPPLAEQQRIVAKVDDLIGQCEKLERNLHKTVAVRNLSLESCISEVQH